MQCMEAFLVRLAPCPAAHSCSRLASVIPSNLTSVTVQQVLGNCQGCKLPYCTAWGLVLCCFLLLALVKNQPLTSCIHALQGISNISVQSSTSLQHLPYNKDLETELPSELVASLAFAKQKVAEIVEAASKAPSASAPASLTAALPAVSESFVQPRTCELWCYC